MAALLIAGSASNDAILRMIDAAVLKRLKVFERRAVRMFRIIIHPDAAITAAMVLCLAEAATFAGFVVAHAAPLPVLGWEGVT